MLQKQWHYVNPTGCVKAKFLFLCVWKMPVQRLKVANLPPDITCSGPITYSWKIFNHRQVSRKDVIPERDNKWPNSMTDIWWWCWKIYPPRKTFKRTTSISSVCQWWFEYVSCRTWPLKNKGLSFLMSPPQCIQQTEVCVGVCSPLKVQVNHVCKIGCCVVDRY